jgi:hypothetical protein
VAWFTSSDGGIVFIETFWARIDTSSFMIDVMEVVQPVPDPMLMIVKNHAQISFIIMKELVSILAQKVSMKTMPPSELVNHAT